MWLTGDRVPRAPLLHLRRVAALQRVAERRCERHDRVSAAAAAEGALGGGSGSGATDLQRAQGVAEADRADGSAHQRRTTATRLYAYQVRYC
ncbi:hypothetical protein P3T76_001632 [Phytophthora citrophthora]|uniref:Uncharacterized protein n=1 Tax=Phytophthora citrophthora TaxID=4793 RepID=A0AAD9GZC4_9STRA|nr:hypothetical protein P3T76_001632 [Phytophthora citrophthora]